jgi:hypothetical protein
MGAPGRSLALLLGVLPLSRSSAACGELGFAPSLLCSSCAKLGEHVGAHDPLVNECLGCCADEAAGAKKHSRAILEVCK